MPYFRCRYAQYSRYVSRWTSRYSDIFVRRFSSSSNRRAVRRQIHIRRIGCSSLRTRCLPTVRASRNGSASEEAQRSGALRGFTVRGDFTRSLLNPPISNSTRHARTTATDAVNAHRFSTPSKPAASPFSQEAEIPAAKSQIALLKQRVRQLLLRMSANRFPNRAISGRIRIPPAASPRPALPQLSFVQRDMFS